MKTLFRLFASLSLCAWLIPERALTAPLVLKRAGAAPVIDGKPQGECWNQADKRPLQEIMRKPLQVKFLWLLYSVAEDGTLQNKVNSNRINRVWFDDVVVSTAYAGPILK